MKRLFAAITVIAVSVLSVSAFAQTTDKNATTCSNNNDCHRNHFNSESKAKACNPFEGLNLTEQQQAALKAIPCPRETMKTAQAQCRNKNNGNQCAGTDRCLSAKEAKANYLKEVKKVLTAEQYVQFLENNFINRRPGHKTGNRPQGKHHRHNHANCNR